jgi:subtilase family serine protease
MKNSVRIFNSMEEQEQFHKQLMLQSTVAERFRKLYQMQQITKLFHPATDHSRKIQIRKWTS